MAVLIKNSRARIMLKYNRQYVHVVHETNQKRGKKLPKFVEYRSVNLRKLYESNNLSSSHQFHIIDEGISMLPSFSSIAGERFGIDFLRSIQIMQSLGVEVNRIVNQCSFSLQKL